MVHARPVFLSIVAGLAALLALAPGCSGNKPPAAEVALTFSVTPGANSAATCQVGSGQGTDWKIGDPPSVKTVPDGGSANGVPVSVQCSVSGNNTSGFSVTATASYGSFGSFLVSGKFSGPASDGRVPTATGIHAQFNSNNGLIASMADDTCTVTFSGQQGIAPTRIWGAIDCPSANDPKRSTTCEGQAEFLFQNCSQ